MTSSAPIKARVFRPDPEFPADPPLRVTRPADVGFDGPASALVLSSPHSGDIYPASFKAYSQLDPHTLRRSEDAFIHELYIDGPSRGAPLLEALFPRAYCDPNRSAYELDPGMFDAPLPPHCVTESSKIGAGLGTIARVVAGGLEIYKSKIPFAEAERRVETCWRPYHNMLEQLLTEARTQHGVALLLDCHSMPSVGGNNMPDAGQRRADMVLGDFHGTSCPSRLVDRAEGYLASCGFGVARNKPYAGGYITQHYARRDQGFFTLQLEINRDLYMDEEKIVKSAGFARVQRAMTGLIELLIASATPDFLHG
ncbi:N-formylglutamate amidohydrolase [Ferrovibrio terrae]|uniref:N-formylglutamate amidohydrolase n=1 Tax=Ferrovibrio terrae TaxID=2594003 RepID=A0A516GZ96_9PROT|nr:N-formylglutamate amidohydrolase [Ferrovibrio terrae]QDO96822.1 N-formylglutamate amidohydrolase [Ferrovibrio terrae]